MWSSVTKLGIAVLAGVLAGRSSSGTGAPAQQGAGTPRAKLKPKPSASARPTNESDADASASPGQFGASRTTIARTPGAGSLTIEYAPSLDGDPDAGEVVWTWVPYDENDGRGKDRPVLVIARAGEGRVLAVRLTSKAHDGERGFLSIGSGAWDSQGRESWVDIDQLYSVHRDGLRREAAVLDARRYGVVAKALNARYGWAVQG